MPSVAFEPRRPDPDRAPRHRPRPGVDHTGGDDRCRRPGGGGRGGDELGDAVRGAHLAFGVDPPPKARRGLGAKILAPGRAPDGHRREVGGLDEDRRRRGGDLARLATHDPGDADRDVVPVADHQILDRAIPTGTVTLETEDPRLPVEGRELLTGPGETDAQPAARQPVEVVGVGRLAELEHRVVRGVDDRVDRPHPRRGCRRRWTSGGEATAVIPVTHPGGEAGAGSGASLTTPASESTAGPVSVTIGAGTANGRCRARREVPGDPRHAQAVGPVRFDLEVEHDVGREPEVLGDRRAELHAGRQGGVGGARRGEDEDAPWCRRRDRARRPSTAFRSTSRRASGGG